MATLTPFRYPGAKNKLLPVLMPHIDSIINGNNSFADVFIGGGSVILEIAQKYPNIKLYANDKDKQIYYFWKIISTDNKSNIIRLCELLNNKPTIDLFYRLREEPANDEIDFAYRALFFNRTTFSGINKINSSPIGGKNQISKYKIDCRFNNKKIIDKIIKINQLLLNRLYVTNENIINCELLKNNIPVYLDPPYFMAGKQLYTEYMNENEHKELSFILKNKKNWLLSYDNCDTIISLYNWANIQFIDTKYCIDGIKKNWKDNKEVLIKP